MTNPEATYAAYVIAAYAIAFVFVGGLTMWTVVRSRVARRTWAQLEAESKQSSGGASVVERAASHGRSA